MANVAYFDTKPIPAAIDPEGGCSLQLKERPIIEDDALYEEIKSEYSLPLSPKLIEFVTTCTLTGITKKVAKDCNPRKIGNLLKVAPVLRGKVSSIYSPYDPETCSCAIAVSTLSGLSKTVDETLVSFVNVRNPDNKVSIQTVTYVGASISGVIKKGKDILATGLNTMYLTGDTIIVNYVTTQGTSATATIVPTESDICHMLFTWPAALDDAAVGSEVVITFKTRGGLEDADPQTNVETVVVLDRDGNPPTVTSVKSDGAEEGTCNKGSSFDIVGTNLAFAAVKLEWVDSATRTQQTATVADAELTRTGTTKITVSSAGWAVCQGEAYDDQFVVRVVTDGGSASKTCQQG